jgi:hypothetical protein
VSHDEPVPKAKAKVAPKAKPRDPDSNDTDSSDASDYTVVLVEEGEEEEMMTEDEVDASSSSDDNDEDPEAKALGNSLAKVTCDGGLIRMYRRKEEYFLRAKCDAHPKCFKNHTLEPGRRKAQGRPIGNLLAFC